MNALIDSHPTAAGTLTLAASDDGVIACTFRGPAYVLRLLGDTTVGAGDRAAHWLGLAIEELDSYFAGGLREFTVPVDLRLADPIHRAVLNGLSSVGYGATTTYGELAAALGLPPGSAQAVGKAMAYNPVLIVVPCHRVLGSGGSLVGYAGGLKAKRHLLDLESADVTPRLALDF